MFKTKDGYELELQTPETMKLFGSSKISILKTENGENVPSLQVLKVVLVRCNLIENQYQKEIFYTFTQNKSYYQRVVAF